MQCQFIFSFQFSFNSVTVLYSCIYTISILSVSLSLYLLLVSLYLSLSTLFLYPSHTLSLSRSLCPLYSHINCWSCQDVYQQSKRKCKNSRRAITVGHMAIAALLTPRVCPLSWLLITVQAKSLSSILAIVNIAGKESVRYSGYYQQCRQRV